MNTNRRKFLTAGLTLPIAAMTASSSKTAKEFEEAFANVGADAKPEVMDVTIVIDGKVIGRQISSSMKAISKELKAR